MIDINELRRLTQAAMHPVTKGRWMRLFGERTVYDRMEDGCRGIPVVSTPFSPPHPFEAACLDFIAAANPTAISELLDRLEAAEKERDELRAKVAGLVPIGLLHVGGYYGEELEDWEFEADQQACDRLNEAHFQREATLNLYALPCVKGEEK